MAVLPRKVVDVELSEPVADVEGLDGYGRVTVIARLHGAPVGYVDVPITAGRCLAAAIVRRVHERLAPAVAHHLLVDAVAAGRPPRGPEGWVAHPVAPHEWPSVTVAVCTRDRTEQLARCLDAVVALDYPDLEVLVVDNAPATDRTEQLVRSRYPTVRHVVEPRPGLDWARNRAIVESTTEVLAYTDDDVVVDPGWARGFAVPFAESPEVMAVTGLVVPLELETEAQILFEQLGGFGRGFSRRWIRVPPGQPAAPAYAGTGSFGTGANMAYRRRVFDEIGGFDPALDVGTAANGGGDLEMFFRVVKAGHTLVYEPSAVVRHGHRRTFPELRTQTRNDGVGVYSYLVRAALAHPEERQGLARLGLWWMWHGNLRRLGGSLVRPSAERRALAKELVGGSLRGLATYPVARRQAEATSERHGPIAGLPEPRPRERPSGPGGGIAVRVVDIAVPLDGLTELAEFGTVRVVVQSGTRVLGAVDIPNLGQDVAASRLADAIVGVLGDTVLEAWDDCVLPSSAAAVVTSFLGAQVTPPPATMRPPVGLASVVVATLDRPDELRRCLRALHAQRAPCPVEIVVVDNNRASGLTPAAIAEFPEVRLLSEDRRGLSYARNRGIVASSGDVVVTTDDDVTMPAHWLEQLLRPFADPEVMVVTGNTLPLELDTPAQQLYERYNKGLGRGYERRRYDREWFDRSRYALPTWDIGATANAAFRAEIFADPDIGLFSEALGAGTPAGCSEDTYLFYKVLKAGYAIVYEPSAVAWHRHRREMEDLRKQLYDYSRGNFAYHAATLIDDGDPRALPWLAKDLPLWRARQLAIAAVRRSQHSLPVRLAEAAGFLAGPYATWSARQRVRELGRSDPYVPPAQRPGG